MSKKQSPDDLLWISMPFPKRGFPEIFTKVAHPMKNSSTSEQVQLAARKLFKGVAPERQEELKELWSTYQPRFNILTDAGPEPRFVMGAGLYREVIFNHRALRAFWLAAFIAWEGYLQVFEVATDGSASFERFDNMVKTFFLILKEDDPLSVDLPPGVSEPGNYPDAGKYPQERVAAELATFATGWALLHEIRHLIHQQDGTGAGQDDAAEKHHEEELSCDEYATAFILDGVIEYANQEDVNADSVRLKRELGIYFAMFAMTLISAGKWSSSNSHPEMQARIDAVTKSMGGSGTRVSDAIAHSVFVGLWRSWPDAPGPFKSTK